MRRHHHESVKVPWGRQVTIQPALHEAVWLDDGSSVAGWRPENGVWVRDGWTIRFDASPTCTKGAEPSHDPAFQIVSPDHPMAAHPDQFWVGDAPQIQVGSRDEVRTSMFHVDDSAPASLHVWRPMGP
ncbi:hypothetical protein ABT299_51505 [Spirillospora sp. NPDC000708]|uniref:hypothetical protein n=1 Tax=Actinomadura nitritigenes TaxID=134602 RepID=UPI00334699DE